MVRYIYINQLYIIMINKLAYLIRTTCTSIYTVEKVDLSLFLCLCLSVCLSVWLSSVSSHLNLCLSLLAWISRGFVYYTLFVSLLFLCLSLSLSCLSVWLCLSLSPSFRLLYICIQIIDRASTMYSQSVSLKHHLSSKTPVFTYLGWHFSNFNWYPIIMYGRFSSLPTPVN